MTETVTWIDKLLKKLLFKETWTARGPRLISFYEIFDQWRWEKWSITRDIQDTCYCVVLSKLIFINYIFTLNSEYSISKGLIYKRWYLFRYCCCCCLVCYFGVCLFFFCLFLYLFIKNLVYFACFFFLICFWWYLLSVKLYCMGGWYHSYKIAVY